MFVCLTYSSAQSDIYDGLVAHFPFEVNSEDVSGNETPIYLPPHIQFVNSSMGKALGSSGKNESGQISISNPLISDTFTIAYWINPLIDHNKTYGDSGVTVWHDRTDLNKQSFGFTHSSGNHPIYLQHEYPELIVSDNNSNIERGKSVYYGRNQLMREWQHITLTYDNGNINVYVNSKPIIQNKSTLISPKGRDLKFHIRGKDLLDEIRIYNRVLSANEIQQLYSLNAVISGCINLKNKPIKNGKAMLMQSGEIFQSVPLDSNGCYNFYQVNDEKSFSVLIRRSID
jgi:hypothetical protein